MTNSLRILLLEDSPIDAELTLATLADGGIACEPVRVETGLDFRAALEDGSFDLILADYALPSFDGVSALAIAQAVASDTSPKVSRISLLTSSCSCLAWPE